MQMNILLSQLWQFNFIFSWKWVFGIGQNKRNKLHSCEPRQEATADQQLADLVGPACCCTPETPLASLHHLTIFGDHNSFKIISVICMQPWLNWEEMIKLSSKQHHNQLRKGSVIIQLLNMRVPGLCSETSCQNDSHQLFFLFPICCYHRSEESAHDQVLLWSPVYVKTEISKLKNWAPWVWQRIQLQPMEFSSQSWEYTTFISRPFWHAAVSHTPAFSSQCLAFLQVL